LQETHVIKNSGKMSPPEMKNSGWLGININNILNKKKISSINDISVKKSRCSFQIILK